MVKYESDLICLYGNGSKLEYRTPYGLDLTSGNYSICLKYLTTTNSIPNVSPEKGDKRKYTSNGGTTWRVITFPKGAYEINTLNKYLDKALALNGDSGKIKITFIATEYNIQLTLQSNVQVDMRITGSIHTIIEFNPPLYTTSTTSQNNPKIKPTSHMFVKTNLTKLSRVPWGRDRVIAGIPITAPPGYDITYSHVTEDGFTCIKDNSLSVIV